MKNYADLGVNFRNPIIFADYSDPDVIRVDDTYYLTASSFNYTPGLPILVSKDLVNWKLVNYAIKNIGQERFNIPRHSEGVWAPAIRYHEGVFYIYYGMPDEGYYVVKTKDPYGEWDEPICILPGKGLIDSCPFWDEDGKAYIVHGYAKSRIGFKSILGIFEMNSEGTKAITEDHFIFNGNDPSHPAVTIEGPKVYKRNGYYYIWAPAGGVKEGYQVVLRSRDIHGPYEIKTVMARGNSPINGPHQGGLIDTENGDEWFIHFQDRGLYGRICHLQPVEWKNDWPIVGVDPTEDGIGEPVYEMKKPDTNFVSKEVSYLNGSDDFVDGNIDLCWQWMGDHRDDFYGKTDKGNGLRLYCLNPSKDEEPIIWRSSNVLTQKIIYPVFRADINMDISGLRPGEKAGVCMTGGQYMSAYVEREGDSYFVKVAESEGSDADKREVVKSCTDLSLIFGQTKDISIDKILKDLCFEMTFSYFDTEFDSQRLYYQNINEPYAGHNPSLRVELKSGEGKYIKDLGIDYTPSDHTWVGAKIGIFAMNKNTYDNEHGYADVKSVHVVEL